MSYNPAANTTTTASLAHYPTVYYDKVGLDRLEQMFRFASICEPHVMPQGAGKTWQTYRFTLPGANQTPSAEGVVGSPFVQTSTTVTANLEQYSDFTSSSELLMLTDISPTTERMVQDMSYRAAKTVDVIYRTEFDSNSGASVNTLGSYFSAADARANVMRLQGIDVRPRDGGDFIGIIHPYVAYDLMADNTAGGFIDVLKYADPNRMIAGEVGKIGGVRFLMTTNVNTTGSAPNVLYSTYIAGQGGVGIVDLSGKGASKVVDARNERFQLNITQGGPSGADPEGQIGQYVSYFFVTTAKTLDSTNYRYRIVTSDASLV